MKIAVLFLSLTILCRIFLTSHEFNYSASSHQTIWRLISQYYWSCFQLRHIISICKTFYRIRHRIIAFLEARRQHIKKDQHTQDTWVLCDSVISSRYVFPGWQLLHSCLIELLAQTQVDKPVCHSDSDSSHQDAMWLSRLSAPSFLCSKCETRCRKVLQCYVTQGPCLSPSYPSLWALITKVAWTSFVTNIGRGKTISAKVTMSLPK